MSELNMVREDLLPFLEKHVVLRFCKSGYCEFTATCFVREVANYTLILDILDSSGKNTGNCLYYRYDQIRSSFSIEIDAVSFIGSYINNRRYKIHMSELLSE